MAADHPVSPDHITGPANSVLPPAVNLVYGVWQGAGNTDAVASRVAPMEQACGCFPGGKLFRWQDAHVALGGLAESSAGAPEAATLPEQPVTLLAQARIDNRDELADSLAIPRARAATMDAAELILAAWQRWGENCPQYLLGDFVFVIWDAPDQRLFCARDHMGIKPLFYAQAGGQFVFASDPQVVVAHPDVSDAVSELAVAQYLGEGDLYDERLTFYQSVYKLPPASTITIDANGTRERCYWEPADSPLVRYASEQEYIEQLQDLLQQAITCRLPPTGPVGAHLSGGLDSSGIVAVAGEALRPRNQALHTWSWMRPPRTAEERANPEWQLGQQVADLAGANQHYTSFDANMMQRVLQRDLLRAHDTVDLWYEFAVRPDAAAKGVQVMLSGWGGDQLISHNGGSRHAETFWRGQPLSTLKDMHEASALADRPVRRFLGMCYRDLLLPSLPVQLNGRMRQFKAMQRHFYDCASDEFEQFARQQQRAITPYLRNNTRGQQLAYLRRRLMFSRIDAWAVSGARAGIDYRYPLLDKRIVAFALGLPPEMYRSHGVGRYIYRAAVRRWLPEHLSYASMKAEPIRGWELYATGREAAQAWLQNAELGPSRFVSREKLRQQIQALPDGQAGISLQDITALEAAWKGVLAIKL